MLPRIAFLIVCSPGGRRFRKRARPHATSIATVIVIIQIIGSTVATLKAIILSHKMVSQTAIDLCLVFFEGVSAGAAHCCDRLMGLIVVVTLLPGHSSSSC